MSAERALADLRRVLPRARHVSVVLGAHVEGEEESIETMQRLNMHDEVAIEFKRIVDEFVAGLQDVNLRPYDPGYKPDAQELLYLELEGDGVLQDIVMSVSTLDDLEIFSEDEDVMRNLKFYSIVAGSDRKALFFRVAGPK